MSSEETASGAPPRFILLLPSAPAPPTLAELRRVFGETISDVLKEVATHSSSTQHAAALEIALACPHLVDALDKPRASLYNETQSMVAAIYRLVVAIAAQDDINVEDTDGVDVRVILVAWSPDRKSARASRSSYGPIVDIETLASSGRPWQYAFGVESEAGEEMVREFVAAKSSAPNVEHTTDASDAGTKSSVQASGLSSTMSTGGTSLHHHIAVGGTWDHLHIGHKLLITMTIFLVDERKADGERSATIGITGDQLLLKKKHAALVESWTDRQKAVATFFNAIIDFSQPASPGQRHVSIRDDPGPNGKSIDVHYPNGLTIKCTEIQDPFGPTITEQQMSGLVISAETRAGGKAVNDKRKEMGWTELDVFEVDVLNMDETGEAGGEREGFDSKISSTAIREKLARKKG